jgi:hypothetical protein
MAIDGRNPVSIRDRVEGFLELLDDAGQRVTRVLASSVPQCYDLDKPREWLTAPVGKISELAEALTNLARI